MAHKKGGGTTRGNKDSISKDLEVRDMVGNRLYPAIFLLDKKAPSFILGLMSASAMISLFMH